MTDGAVFAGTQTKINQLHSTSNVVSSFLPSKSIEVDYFCLGDYSTISLTPIAIVCG